MSLRHKTLAIFGGEPIFNHPRHTNLPTIPSREELSKLVDNILDNRVFSNDGPLVQKLEEKIGNFLGVKHCVLVSNGTVGLQLLARGLNLTGEVIMPAFTFIATPNAFSWEGLTPVFCDVKPGSCNIDPNQCRKLVNANTSAIVGVHLWGEKCDTAALDQIALEYGIPAIYDAAHAFGCASKSGRMIGTFGDAEVFSFHATKSFHTGEGGAITTNNNALAVKLRKLRNFGFIDTDETSCLGINGKMSELHAAIGLTNFTDLQSNFEKSLTIRKLYAKLLSNVAQLKMLKFSNPSNNHYVVFLVQQNSEISRDQLTEILVAENILARRYFYPGCHRMQPYKDSHTNYLLPETEKLAQSTIVLPAGANIEADDIEKICMVIVDVFNNANEVSSRLKLTSRL